MSRTCAGAGSIRRVLLAAKFGVMQKVMSSVVSKAAASSPNIRFERLLMIRQQSEKPMPSGAGTYGRIAADAGKATIPELSCGIRRIALAVISAMERLPLRHRDATPYAGPEELEHLVHAIRD